MRDAALFEQLAIGRIHKRAAAQGHTMGLPHSTSRTRLRSASCSILRNSSSPRVSKISAMETPCGLLDVFVDVGEGPAELVRQQAAHGRFPRPHEADQVEAGRALQLQ